MLKNVLVRYQRNIINLKFPRHTHKTVQISAYSRVSTSAQESQHLDEYELQQEHIDEAVRTKPTLSSVSHEMWRNAHKTFSNHGVTTNNFLRIVTSNPKVLIRSPQKIIETLEYWRSCQFGEYFLFLLITKYPFLLDVDDKRSLLKQISFLQSFVGTSKNVWKLLMNCPTLLEHKQSTIEAKILYLKVKMRLEIPEIVKSEALAKSLEDIRCRHIFMERLGIFKPRPLKADPNEASKNPRLYKITDTSEKTFATKVCHVSLAEYEAFKELYSREFERVQQEDDSDVEDDEES